MSKKNEKHSVEWGRDKEYSISFTDALKKLPGFILSSYIPSLHTTIKDLYYVQSYKRS